MDWQDQQKKNVPTNNYGTYGGYYNGYNDTAGSSSYDMYGSYTENGYSNNEVPVLSQAAPTTVNYYNSAECYQYPSQAVPNIPPQMATQPQYAAQPTPNLVSGGQQFMNNPIVANIAMDYGQRFVDESQQVLKQNIDKIVSVGQLKYYFAVDTPYVAKKMSLLLFPFTHRDWSIKYNQDEMVQPKYDSNAPDLYIPFMGYTTYVLLVGYILGLQSAFRPESLIVTASATVVALALELICIFICLAVLNIERSKLGKWDILSFATYKYVPMVCCLLASLLLQDNGYYAVLAYVSVAFGFFTVRTLRLRLEPVSTSNQRRSNVILIYAILQPFLIWWLTGSMILGTDKK